MIRSRFYRMDKNLSFPSFCTIFLCTVYLFFIPRFGEAAAFCEPRNPFVSNLKDIACATSDLRTAVKRSNLLRKVSNRNIFAGLNPNDVVRAVKPLTFFNRALINKIKATHDKYQEEGRERYILSITSYPSSVKENSCPEKTINFRPPSQGSEFPDYSFVRGKRPPSFQAGRYKGKLILCEKTNISYKKKLEAFCGKAVTKCKYRKWMPDDCDEKDVYEACKKDLFPSCSHSKIEEIKLNKDCVSLDEFSTLSRNLLLYNKSLAKQYCTTGCSYYTQTIQNVYRKKGTKDYCSDSYLIVHCGPEKDDSEYNLNIREVNDLCSDFGSPSCVLRL